MKFYQTLLLSLCLLSTHAGATNEQAFQQLDAGMRAITQQLNASKSEQDLAKLLHLLQEKTQEMEHNAKLQCILQLSTSKCPADLQDELTQSLQLKSELQDAAKRLAMSGLLSKGEVAEAFSQYFSLITIAADEQEAQPQHEGTPAAAIANRDERMQWWRDGKFGMFVHYGLYSGLAGEVQGKKYSGCVEWIQMQSGLGAATYAKEAIKRFNYKRGNATKWVQLAKESGCAYIVLTSRHHEGFNMWDTSAVNSFNVLSQKGIDILDEYSAACAKHNIKAGYYFSLIDWHHKDYDPSGSGIAYPAGNMAEAKAGKRAFGQHERYKQYLAAIFESLINKYKVDLVWWDFSQPNFQGDHAWGATALLQKLFAKHPMAIHNNRLYHSDNHVSEGGIKTTPHWKGDYSTAEQHVPATGIAGDWEACQTLNGTWGYSSENQSWKSSTLLIHELIDTVSRGGNYLLNIGPMPDGSIPPESVRLFQEIGAWLQLNGEAIYGTRANPFPVEFPWGRATRKGDDITYLFIYNKPAEGIITLPCSFAEGAQAQLLHSQQAIPMTRQASSSTIDVGNIELTPPATVIKIVGKRLKGTLQNSF